LRECKAPRHGEGLFCIPAFTHRALQCLKGAISAVY